MNSGGATTALFYCIERLKQSDSGDSLRLHKERVVINGAKSGAGIATAAAMLALASMAQAADLVAPVKGSSLHASDVIHCFGVNACKGQSDCETATSGCKTQNACKGKGWKSLTAAKCFAKKGFVGDLILIGQ
jgi:uncharacterized membrane protein